jgi:hypothetical protein
MRHPFITARVVRQAPAATDTLARERPLHGTKAPPLGVTPGGCWQLPRCPGLATELATRHPDRIR